MGRSRKGIGEIFQRREHGVYVIRYYDWRGRRRTESSGSMVKGDAERLLRKRLREKDDGWGTSVEARRLRFEDAVQLVVNDYRLNNRRSIANVELRIRKHLKPFFGGLLVQRIGDRDITEFQLKRRAAGASNAEINRELAIVRRAFKLAKIPNPAEMRMLKESAPRSGFFEREQFESVRSHLEGDLADVVTFAYYMGWRISEILHLEWRQVDSRTGTIRLDAGTTKNDDARVINFGKIVELKTMLDRRLADTANLSRQRGEIIRPVFHRRGKIIRDLRAAWHPACRAAGCPGRYLHDFRRTAVRNLDRAGVSRRVAMQIVGHKTESIYNRYRIVSDSDLIDAADKLNAPATGSTGSYTGSSGHSADLSSGKKST